ncbi:60S ribosomal protein L22 [Aphelenchoides fujianensis]|nr:60S ribosomal protein L22 [Aphelenchoides fujianensis]
MVSTTKKPAAAKSTKEAKTAKPTAPKPGQTSGTAAKPAAKPEAKSAPAKADPKTAAPAKAEQPKAAPPAEKKPAEKPAAPKAQPAKSAKTAQKAKPKPKPKVLKKKGTKKRKQQLNFKIECKNPVEDGIMKTAALEEFLKARLKTRGKVGQLEQNGVKISTTKTAVTVNSETELSKRYLKYLTKKYLKRNALRDWLRVVATTKDTYELRYFQINQDDDAEDNE